MVSKRGLGCSRRRAARIASEIEEDDKWDKVVEKNVEKEPQWKIRQRKEDAAKRINPFDALRLQREIAKQQTVAEEEKPQHKVEGKKRGREGEVEVKVASGAGKKKKRGMKKKTGATPADAANKAASAAK